MRPGDVTFAEWVAEVLDDPDALLEWSAEAVRAARGETEEGASQP